MRKIFYGTLNFTCRLSQCKSKIGKANVIHRHLVQVCTSDELGAEEEVFTSSECEVSSDHVERVLHVALVRVEHVSLVTVVLAHHFHAEAIDGSLEVALFRVDHHSNIAFFRMLPQCHLFALAALNVSLNYTCFWFYAGCEF